MQATTVSTYDALGGAEGVRRLVDRFYEVMDELPETYAVRQLHPESLAGSAESLYEFLSGWFGGPSLYVAKKGHPRLRMRHHPYAISPARRDEWMLCMTTALSEQVSDESLRERLMQKFAQMADHIVNTDERTACSHAAQVT